MKIEYETDLKNLIQKFNHSPLVRGYSDTLVLGYNLAMRLSPGFGQVISP